MSGFTTWPRRLFKNLPFSPFQLLSCPHFLIYAWQVWMALPEGTIVSGALSCIWIIPPAWGICSPVLTRLLPIRPFVCSWGIWSSGKASSMLHQCPSGTCGQVGEGDFSGDRGLLSMRLKAIWKQGLHPYLVWYMTNSTDSLTISIQMCV
jgi:hypothetical protein